MPQKWRRRIVRLTLLISIPYIIFCAVIFLFQRHMIYFPGVQTLAAAMDTAKSAGLEPWTTLSGEFIGWKKLSPANGANTSHLRVLVAHGNAGMAIHRADYADALNHIEPCDVYLLEYPGYGPRSGSPSQESLFRAAEEAILLLEKDGPVCVIGESLGTGVAAHIAGTHPKSVAALLLVAPYHNLADVAQAHMPILPAKYLLLDKFRSAEYLRNYHGPLAVLLAGNDTTVPKKFGQQLFDAYAGPKKVWEIQGADHNDLPHAAISWWKELLTFWKAP
jgi:fermentation-respiration switch protein FrsA (DUF1100 family)